jgi:GH15 family glucan-1,4-alpha-glucosidase
VSYRAIHEHGVIGDLNTAALVACDGTIDFCCLPRFDSPTTFAALLDEERGGRWLIGPSVASISEQRYLPGTNVLSTTFRPQEGVGALELLDFMPVGPRRGRFGRIMRRLRAVRGSVPAQVIWEPRLEYAATPTRVTGRRAGFMASDRFDDVVTLCASDGIDWSLSESGASGTLTLEEGAQAWFVMTFDDDEVRPLASHDCDATLDDTVRYWDAWSAKMQYNGPYRAEVERSVLALKLLCCEPTGAIVAAPTTSLPESTQGGRTWDYRYVWLRDAAFVLQAFEGLGYTEETEAFMGFLKRVCRREDGRYIQIMYATDARRPPEEKILEHLRGWRGLGPVRIGNGAVDQFQMDVYGELLATVAEWGTSRTVSEGTWISLHGLIDWTSRHWSEPDFSIWEPRVAPRHHVFSKIMAWVTLDHGAALAERHSLPGDTGAWRREAEKLRAEILERGFDTARNTFIQSYDHPALDAALLVVPKVRFLPHGDPRVRGTLDAVRKELATPVEELIYRYRSEDGLTGDEGAFIFCSFWVIQNLAMIGELAEAERLFKNLLRRSNAMGLLAEEIDPLTGAQMGNFPQGLSHAALINTATILEKLRGGVSPAAEVGPTGLI